MIKKSYYLLVFFVLITTTSFSQFKVVIELANANACQNDSVQFVAKATNGAVSETDVLYKWSFGDESSIQSGLDLDTIKHPFVEGGGYIVRVEASKGVDEDYALQKVQVSLTADFSKTESDRAEPICLGQFVRLTGIADTVSWEYEVPDEIEEDSPVELSQGNIYSTSFDFKCFDKSQTVSSVTDIDTIGVLLEHTNLSNLKIELTCSNGSSIILKDFGGEDKYFGEPIDDEASDLVGVGYYYYWINIPDNGAMNSATPSGDELPAGSYTSDEPFANLLGCSLNGLWTITLTDNQATDKGFVFAARLKFNDALLPADWEFKNTYGLPVWIGNGVSNTLPDGSANATPVNKGNSEYVFQVTDNFSCKQDTSIFVSVEGASFTANPIEGDFDLDVTFTSETSWATEYRWDFGDESDVSIEESPVHTYTYPDDIYIVIYTAITDDGCEDVDTTTITITIPDPVFNEPPNVFSPNNDGVNDSFNLDVDDLAGLEGWIYSRWGKTVCRWKSIEEAQTGWNGKILNGNQDATPGVYYYYIKAVDYFGVKIIKNGSVQLFR